MKESNTSNNDKPIEFGLESCKVKCERKDLKAAVCSVATVGITLIAGWCIKRGINHLCKVSEQKHKCEEERKNMEVATDEKIRLIEARSKAEKESYAQKKEWEEYKRSIRPERPEDCTDINKSFEGTDRPFSIDEWTEKNPMPKLQGDLKVIISQFPEAYKPAVLFALLSMYGALVYPKVVFWRNYKTEHPSIQVIIEAESGAGKSILQTLYKDLLFKKVYDSDTAKLNDVQNNQNRIIQTISCNTSSAAIFDIILKNQDEFLFAFEPELRTVLDNMSKGKGFSYADHRKAFDNDDIYQLTKNVNTATGRAKLNYNYVYTAPHVDVAEFMPEKQVQGGTASRICWAFLPECGKYKKEDIKLPQGDTLKNLQDNIENARKKFCYTAEGDKDTAQPEHEIDITYVDKELDRWRDQQKEQAEEDGCHERVQFLDRFACMAIHCAMVIHMMYNEAPNPADKDRVVELTLYIANYLMDIYLNRFAHVKGIPEHNSQYKKELTEHSSQYKKELTEEECREIYDLKRDTCMSWQELADEYGFEKRTDLTNIMYPWMDKKGLPRPDSIASKSA